MGASQSRCSGGSCSSSYKGKGKVQKISTVTPQQASILKLLSGLGQNVAPELYNRMMGDPQAGFDPIARNVRERYTQQGIPTIAERFMNMDNPENRQSDFYRTLTSGGLLESGLGAHRAQFGANRMGEQLGLLGTLLGQGSRPQFESILRQKGPNPWMQFAGTMGSSALGSMGGR